MVDRFGPLSAGPVLGEGSADGEAVTVTNPLSSQHSIMRQSLIGSLVEIVSTNVRQGRADVPVFEVGKGYAKRSDGPGTHEWWRLGLALTGSLVEPAPDRAAAPVDIDDAKGLIDLLAHRLGMPRPRYSPLTDDPNLHPGRAAMVSAGDRLAGRLGELHPDVADALELRGRVIVAELAIAGLSGGQPAVPRIVAPSRYPAVERDLAVVVREDVRAAAVADSIEAHAGPLLRSVRLFDVYRGRPLGDDERSLAFRLVFQAPDRTLAETEIDAAVTDITTGVGADVGGRIRS